jgi:ParB family chromosome partitioning protein
MTLDFAARHSCDSPEWYTPSPVVESARLVMNGIDLDPASCAEANATVKADRFLAAENDGLPHPWHGRVFVNPPGGLVKEFWQCLMWEAVDQKRAKEVIWIGYSLEQLQVLQQFDRHPLHFPICITAKRTAFIENAAKKAERIAKAAAKGKKAGSAVSPSHSNYICYIGPNVDRFYAEFGRIGHCGLFYAVPPGAQGEK